MQFFFSLQHVPVARGRLVALGRCSPPKLRVDRRGANAPQVGRPCPKPAVARCPAGCAVIPTVPTEGGVGDFDLIMDLMGSPDEPAGGPAGRAK